jgi:predicted nucleic acid-binding protein
MDRLFLDANVLFSAAYRSGAGLLRFWHLKNVILCSSHYALEEARINLSDDAQRGRLVRLARKIQLFDSTARQMPAGISLPEKDRPILLAAMEAWTTHLITGDLRHFGPYFGKTIGGILIVTPCQYLKTHQPR